MVSRGAAAAGDRSGGGSPTPLRLMPTMRLEQTPEFLAAIAPTEGHPDCATHCGVQAERQSRKASRPGVNVVCDQCICAKVCHCKSLVPRVAPVNPLFNPPRLLGGCAQVLRGPTVKRG